MNGHDPGPGPESVELRLEAALRARADSVGLADLRPAHPPSGPSVARVTPARAALALLALAAVAVCVLLLAQREADTPIRPAGPPTVTPSPTQTRSPSPTVYSPEPSGLDATPSVPEAPAPTR
ncbi:hypothetical protein AB0H86_27365 [Streptomyces sp. NPDC050997]|uniref:hypothetical protein n=1 Tax=Streptomyces sp. NPDC050997 TaxID=3155519 RepID=UPI0034214158